MESTTNRCKRCSTEYSVISVACPKCGHPAATYEAAFSKARNDYTPTGQKTSGLSLGTVFALLIAVAIISSLVAYLSAKTGTSESTKVDGKVTEVGSGKTTTAENESETEPPVTKQKTTATVKKRADPKKKVVLDQLRRMHRAVSTGVAYNDFNKMANELQYDLNAWIKTSDGGEALFENAAGSAASSAQVVAQLWAAKIENRNEVMDVRDGRIQHLVKFYPKTKKPQSEGGASFKSIADGQTYIVMGTAIQIMLTDLTELLDIAIIACEKSNE